MKEGGAEMFHTKSNLPLTEINKILNNLESKKLITAIKFVTASKKVL